MQPPEAAAPRVRTTAQPWGTRVELCAPDVRNALDPPTVSFLHDVFSRDGDGALLVCADGPVFCAGGDLSVLAGAATGGDLAPVLTSGAAAFAAVTEAVVSCPRPVVAAVGGAAVGGGVSLVLACDVVIAAPQARLVLGWGRWGLPPDGGASALLAAAVGPARARALLMQQAELSPDHPLGPLLFDRVVPADRLDEEAVELAKALGSSPGARAAKAATRELLLPTLRAQSAAELAALAAAAEDTAVAATLALLYKMKR